MPEAEFEAYLAAMAKLMRLSPKQRNAIAGELRDHLETRLDELTEKGIARDEAIQQALDEFGDAAVLGHDLSQPRHRQQRRRLMQTSLATAAVATIAVLVTTSLLPPNNPASVPHADAGPAQTTKPKVHILAMPPATQPRKTEPTPLEAKLQKRTTLKFEDNQLASVIAFFREFGQINIVVQWNAMDVAGVRADSPVTLQLKDVTIETALRQTLGLFPQSGIAYRVDGDVVVISTRQYLYTLETRTYDCRDLVAIGTSLGIQDADSRIGGYLIDAMGPAAWKQTDASRPHNDQPSVAVYAGVLTVRQTPEAHTQVQRILDATRSVLLKRPDAAPSPMSIRPADTLNDALKRLASQLRPPQPPSSADNPIGNLMQKRVRNNLSAEQVKALLMDPTASVITQPLSPEQVKARTHAAWVKPIDRQIAILTKTVAQHQAKREALSRAGHSDQHPEVQRITRQITAIRKQIDALQLHRELGPKPGSGTATPSYQLDPGQETKPTVRTPNQQQSVERPAKPQAAPDGGSRTSPVAQ